MTFVPKVGEIVNRVMGYEGPTMSLKITEVHDEHFCCGPWTFDIATGAEIDEDLDWGPPPKNTGTYIQEITENVHKAD